MGFSFSGTHLQLGQSIQTSVYLTHLRRAEWIVSAQNFFHVAGCLTTVVLDDYFASVCPRLCAPNSQQPAHDIVERNRLLRLPRITHVVQFRVTSSRGHPLTEGRSHARGLRRRYRVARVITHMYRPRGQRAVGLPRRFPRFRRLL